MHNICSGWMWRKGVQAANQNEKKKVCLICSLKWTEESVFFLICPEGFSWRREREGQNIWWFICWWFFFL